MSGIAGIFHLDGRPVDSNLLTRMTDVIAYRGPDGAGHWIDGPVGLGHRMLHTTPEALYEQQPLLDETGQLCLVLDGRVDNRDELISALRYKGARLRNDTDAEIVLRAYECWGEECPKKIIGDFAFAIWDGRKQQLFCARDPLGIRPLYYYSDSRTFLCVSEPRQFFENIVVKRRPNEGMIGEYLANEFRSHEETLYQDILRLAPAHSLVVRPGRIQKQRYWDIDLGRAIRYRSDAEYAEHFLAVFREAVRCRLRSCGPVGAELSGGLDSSSVVAIAKSLYDENALPDLGFETFSLVFPGMECDESAYIQDVVRMLGIKSNTVSPNMADLFGWYAEEIQRSQDFPCYSNTVMSHPLNALASAKGHRVLLTGCGGDEWFTGSIHRYTDFVRNFQLMSLFRQFSRDLKNSHATGIKAFQAALHRLLGLGVLPLIPPETRRLMKRLLRRPHDTHPWTWMNRDYIDRIGLADRLHNESVERPFSSFAQRGLYSTLDDGFLPYCYELASRFSMWFGIELRHPFLDQRVVECALALPEEQRWQPNQPKFIIRQAMAERLPSSVRHRRTKSNFAHVCAETLKGPGVEHLFDTLAIAEIGWVDGSQTRAMYRQFEGFYKQGDSRYGNHLWTLWWVFGIELWFNLVFLNRDPLRDEELLKLPDNRCARSAVVH